MRTKTNEIEKLKKLKESMKEKVAPLIAITFIFLTEIK